MAKCNVCNSAAMSDDLKICSYCRGNYCSYCGSQYKNICYDCAKEIDKEKNKK
jgi:hypothetical protein